MLFGVLLVLSLILINLENMPLFKISSFYLSVVGIALLSGILVYVSFNPPNYMIGILTVAILTLLTALEKSEKYNKYRGIFLTIEILVAIAEFSSNLIIK